MSEPIVEWVGSSCGRHGTYTFYKGFTLKANGETRKYTLGEFYFIRNSKDRPICIAEFQLIWHDANSDDKLASARLYFRPESIPGGRQTTHGKDELLCADEKVVIRCKEMMNLEYDGTCWSYGIKAISELCLQEVSTPGNDNESENGKKFRLLKRKPKSNRTVPKDRSRMVILTFPAYCRFKSLLRKLLNGLVLTKIAIKAFGGVIHCNDTTWVSFSRYSFHYPGLSNLDMFMQHKAPVFKGRPRKRKMSKRIFSREEVEASDACVEQSLVNEADSSDENLTDTASDTGSVNVKLPCLPRLVPGVKDDSKYNSVITHMKQERKPIPPVPKLIKIETKNSAECEDFDFAKVLKTDDDRSKHFNDDKNLAPQCRVDRISDSCYVDNPNPLSVKSRYPFDYVNESDNEDNPNVHSVKSPWDVAIESNNSAHVSSNDHLHMQSRVPTIVANKLMANEKEESGKEVPLKRKRARPPGRMPSKCFKSFVVDEIAMDKLDVKSEQILMKEDSYVGSKIESDNDAESLEERVFMKDLKTFMRKRGMPIDKIPHLGLEKVNLFEMFHIIQSLGGYDQVIRKKLWCHVYSKVCGSPNITSVAINSKRTYEKFLLPFERYLRGEEVITGTRSYTHSTAIKQLSSSRDVNGNVLLEVDNVAPYITSGNTSVSQLKVVNKRSPIIQTSQQDILVSSLASNVINRTSHCSKVNSTAAPNAQSFYITCRMNEQDELLHRQSLSSTSRRMPYANRHEVMSTERPIEVRSPSPLIYAVDPEYCTRTGYVNYQSLHDRPSVVSYSKIPRHDLDERERSPVTVVNRESPLTFYKPSAEEKYTRSSVLLDHDTARGNILETGTQNLHRVKSSSDSSRGSVVGGRCFYSKETVLDTANQADLRLIRHESDLLPSERKETGLSSYLHHVSDSSISRDSYNESRDVRKHIKKTMEDPFFNNSFSGKRTQTSNDSVMYSMPMIDSGAHYPYSGFDFYDLPAFPVRASSRIFIPPHPSLYPGHSVYVPYNQHILPTDPNGLCPLPVYPHEYPFAVDAGVGILRS